MWKKSVGLLVNFRECLLVVSIMVKWLSIMIWRMVAIVAGKRKMVFISLYLLFYN